MKDNINIIYDFLDSGDLGGIERVIVFQSNTIKNESEFEPRLFFSHIEPGKESLLNTELGLSKGTKIFDMKNNHGKIYNFIHNMLFPHTFTNLGGPIVSHSFLSSRMALARKESSGGNYIIFAQHPPNFLYDRTWGWVNNFSRFVAYVAGFFLGPLLRRWDKAAMMGAQTIYVNSNYTKNRIERIYGHPNIKIMYPPIGEQFQVSSDLKREKQKKLLIKKGIIKPFVLIHGRQIKDKHPEWAIEAFSLINQPNIDLVISGTIEDKNKLEKIIKERDIEGKVHLLGRVTENELLALYNNAKCFIMSAPKEDFGLTTVEALACGTPAVAWDDGAGPSEVIIPGVNGELASPYDIISLSTKIDHVLNNTYNRNKVSKSVDKFKANVIMKQFLDSVKEAMLNYRYGK